ncbi:CMO [Symbiodinium microadriaticum]|nr:CMO [Symbiodinium microadriaticum]
MAKLEWTNSNSMMGLKVTQITSKATGKTYPIAIGLPHSYDHAADKSYPVIYTTDAEGRIHGCTEVTRALGLTGDCAEVIMVGVYNPAHGSREEDLTPNKITRPERHASDAVYETSGQAPAFHQFFKEELIPAIEADFRTSDQRIYFGHSLGGLFGLYALHQDDDPFTDYLISAPSVWWNDREILQGDGPNRKDPTMVYLNVGEFEQIPPGLPQDIMDLFPEDVRTRDAEARMVEGMIETFTYLKAQPNIEVYGFISEGAPHMTAGAETFSGPAYWLPEAEALEETRLFRRAWSYFCKAEDVAQPGHYMAREFFGEQVIVTRDKAGDLHALSNVCRHRAGPIMDEGAGEAKTLKCRYHRWTYSLDGQLRGAPDFPEFDTSTCRLPEYHVAEWGPFIFVALDDPGQPLDEALGPILDWASNYNLGSLQHSHRSSFVIDCNWKAFVENSLEVYHVQTIHPILWASSSLDHYTITTDAPLVARQLSYSRDMREGSDSLSDESVQKLLRALSPAQPGLTDDEANISQFINFYPGFILNLHPDHVNTVWAEPAGPDQTRVTMDYWFPESRAAKGRVARWLRNKLDPMLTDAAAAPMPDTDAMAGEELPGWLSPLIPLLANLTAENRRNPVSRFLRDHIGAELARALTIYYTDLTLREDMGIARDTQRNLKSSAYKFGNLVPARENAVHHFQNYVRHMVGVDET